MRRIIVGAQLSIDGVMQAPGGQKEDTTGGFRFGGWAMPHFDQVAGEEINKLFEPKCDLLLGRRTYEIFASFWPHYDESGDDGVIARLFNSITKYVVSASGKVDTSWKNTVLLRSIDDVRRLKQEKGPKLVTQGSTKLLHDLFAHDLVDALSTFTMPVILGGGKKLFADGSAPHGYKLMSSRVSPSGMMIAHYERAGDVKVAEAS
jgi:dihydrofolate reductase